MLYKEIEGYVPFYKEDACFVNYIDADFQMDGELALEFEDNFHVKEKLRARYGTFTSIWDNDLNPGFCLQEGQVFNLVIKKHKSDQYKYRPFGIAIYELFLAAQEIGCKKLIFPKYESEEQWRDIKYLIKETFDSMDIEIEVYGFNFEDKANSENENRITSAIEAKERSNSANLIKPVSLKISKKNTIVMGRVREGMSFYNKRCRNMNSIVIGTPGAGKGFCMNKNEVENEREDKI